MCKLTAASFFVFFAIFGHSSSDDKGPFRNCSQVPFCNGFRIRDPEFKYHVDPLSVGVDLLAGQVVFTLVPNDKTANLTGVLNVLKNHTFRVKIKELYSRRYELKDVLVEEPATIQIQASNKMDNNLTIVTEHCKVFLRYSPLQFEFYHNDVLELVLDGSRLIFDRNLDQAFAFGVTFPQASELYGIHEHADNLVLQTTEIGSVEPYRLRNLDFAGYPVFSPMALYGAVPVLYGHGTKATSGIFLHNAAEQWWEIKNHQVNPEAFIMVESGSFDIFILLGPTPRELVRQHVSLTGVAHLPQYWTLGYHQSRWNYMNQEDVKDVVARFSIANFPLDAIWLDIEYTDSKKYFTWDPTTFSDPIEMQRNISAAHKRLVTIIDPHIKVEKGYEVYDGAAGNNFFVKNPNGSYFEGECWPGISSYIDFLNPEARDYFSSFYSFEKFPGSTPVLAGIWNDMNEPSVFDDALEKTLPGDAVHWDSVLHRDIHNIYGFLQTMSTHKGLMDRDNGTFRPFILTRSHFAGSQRFAAVWTGDNVADWNYLSISYAECLNANMLGLVFCGADVPGFIGEPDDELIQRWYQSGAWLPFYRAHANMSTERREPYLFEEKVQEVVRKAMQLRYMHIPVWYTLFYEHTRYGDPVIRPLFYQYPQDKNTFNLENHLLVGSDILVRAIAEPGVEYVQVYFPGGPEQKWASIYDLFEVYHGNSLVDIRVDIEKIPVFYRAGSIIVRKDDVRLSTDEFNDVDYSIFVLLDARTYTATGTVYLDDHTSFSYVNKKEYNYLRIDALDYLTIKVTKLDEDANSDNFEFIVGTIVTKVIVEDALDGKPGIYEQKLYTKDANNNLLRDLRFNFNNGPVVINLA